MLKIFLEILKMLSSKASSKASNIATEAPNITSDASNIKDDKMSKQPKTYITVEDVITSSGRYPERAKSPELTQEVLANIAKTVELVNALLNELDWQENVSISSGFRTSASNSATQGAAKRSSHMLGMAVDIMQPKSDNKLGKAIRALQDNKGKDGILGRHGLMMESIEVTVGQNTSWVHLDWVSRPFRASYEFKP